MQQSERNRAPRELAHAGRARVGILATLALAGCTLGPNFHTPPAPATQHYTPGPQPEHTVEAPGVAGAAQTFVSERDIPADWWTLFQSAALDELVREALRDSPNIAAAKAALRSAEEGYKAQRGASFLPSIDAQLQGTRERVPGAVFGQPDIPASVFTLYDASVNVAYRLDLFGAERRQVEALRAQAEYEGWELEAADLTLTANVVTAAVTVASLRAQIAAVSDIVASEQQQLEVIERQFTAGGAARSDVLSQRSQLSQTEAMIPPLDTALAQAQHRLAVLAGHTPDTEQPAFELAQLTLPTELPVSVPAKLVRQRPDVRAAEALLHEATAQAGVATANLYPQLNLTGSIGSETVSASDLFKSGTAAWSMGGTLMQPLFHGGELLAKRRGAYADLDRATAQYRQAVLSALQEVADTLRALEADARALRAQASAESAASDALDITRKQYQAGAVSYVQLLIAQRQYAQARQARVQAQAARYADSAALYQALGGGWWNREHKVDRE
jgi:NodT family efflux transporter outer membrane factor (OMF) lipoprotein